MASTTIDINNRPIEVEMTVGRGRTIERFDDVRYMESGRKVDLARRDMHSRVYRAVLSNLQAGNVSFEPGEDPDNIFIDEEGLAGFND